MQIIRSPLVLRELTTVAEIPSLLRNYPRLRDLPGGNGETIVLVPGLLADDSSLLVLRWFLRSLGYQAVGWGMGFNLGDVELIAEKLRPRLLAIAQAAQSKITLIGWSLGGLLSREFAREHPDLVEQVITMGTPVMGGARYTVAARYYRHILGFDLDDMEEQLRDRDLVPLKVPVCALYSRRDGIVSWQACIDSRHHHIEHVEVDTTHLGFGLCPEVYEIIARKLQDPAIMWCV